MTLAIVFVTRNDNLSRLIGSRKNSLIPVELRRNQYLQKSAPSLLSYLVQQKFDHDEFADYLQSLSREREGIVIICDTELVTELSVYSSAVFAVPFSSPQATNQLQNGVGAILTRAVRAFAHLSTRFDDGHSRKLLLLPLRNFQAAEISQLAAIFSPSVDIPKLTSQLDNTLGQLRSRQTPKRQTNYRQTYIVDDRSRYFEYGHEHHALPETKSPPHLKLCGLNAFFRFGRKYDEKRHFNVSEASGRISGVYANCHNDDVEISERTHINMFPNGLCS